MSAHSEWEYGSRGLKGLAPQVQIRTRAFALFSCGRSGEGFHIEIGDG